MSRANVPQSWQIVFLGIAGLFLGFSPLLLLLPSVLAVPPLPIFIASAWACLAGLPVTSAWSKALFRQVFTLSVQLDSIGGLPSGAKELHADRVDWIPAWIGLFERILYSLLVGLNIGGGAAFIGVWVGIKVAGGWQIWSKGTTYGRAVFFVSLLGSAMSALFGVVAGLVIRFYTPLPLGAG